MLLLGPLLALPAIGAQLGPKDGAELPASDLIKPLMLWTGISRWTRELFEAARG